MAHEYLITPIPADNEAFVTLCVRLGGRQRTEAPTTYEFRAPNTRSRSTSPDATVTLDPGEVWLLDYGGPPEFVALILRHLLDAALIASPDGIFMRSHDD